MVFLVFWLSLLRNLSLVSCNISLASSFHFVDFFSAPNCPYLVSLICFIVHCTDWYQCTSCILVYHSGTKLICGAGGEYTKMNCVLGISNIISRWYQYQFWYKEENMIPFILTVIFLIPPFLFLFVPFFPDIRILHHVDIIQSQFLQFISITGC